MNLNNLQVASLAHGKIVNVFKGNRGQIHEQIRNFKGTGMGGSDRS